MNNPNKTPREQQGVSNTQRGFWVFLGYTLVGPFFAGLAVVAIIVLAPLLKLTPLLPQDLPAVGEAGLRTFIWAAPPSAMTALALLPLVFRDGTFAVLWAAAAGIVSFAIAGVLFPIGLPEHLTALAFLAAFVAIAVRAALIAGGILIETK